jgi:2-amino-4-hydroxy-6-hydroxymethyldihydropteridine diphosphokinase
MTAVHLCLGSNLGDRLDSLTHAVRRLEGAHTRLLKVSSVYETVPQGVDGQPAYLNVGVLVDTTLTPMQLLDHIHTVENDLGRVRQERWGARTIDIDIIRYGTLVQETPDLTIPHARMLQRAYVMIPLLEMEHDPVVAQTLAALPDQGVVHHLDAKTFLRRVRGVQ